jgi:hypothetical protein
VGEMCLRSWLFWDVTQHRAVVTDISERPIGAIFRDKAVQEEFLRLLDHSVTVIGLFLNGRMILKWILDIVGESGLRSSLFWDVTQRRFVVTD